MLRATILLIPLIGYVLTLLILMGHSARRNRVISLRRGRPGEWSYDPLSRKVRCPHGNTDQCLVCGDVRAIIREAHDDQDCDTCGVHAPRAVPEPQRMSTADWDREIRGLFAVPSIIIGSEKDPIVEAVAIHRKNSTARWVTEHDHTDPTCGCRICGGPHQVHLKDSLKRRWA